MMGESVDNAIWRFVFKDMVSKDGFDKFYDERATNNSNTSERQYLMNVIFDFVNWEVVARIASQASEQFYKNE